MRKRKPDPVVELLTSGRLNITTVRRPRTGLSGCVHAVCHGASGKWLVGWTAGDGWFCSCPDPRRGPDGAICKHAAATRKVVSIDLEDDA